MTCVLQKYLGLTYALQYLGPVLVSSVALSVSAAAASDGPALVNDRGCMSCHGLVHQQVGPGFGQIAARYRTDADAPSRLALRIRGGGVGTWGRVVMPPQPRVTAEESKRLAVWILSQPTPR